MENIIFIGARPFFLGITMPLTEEIIFYKIAVALAFIIGFGAGITFMILFVGCHVQS